MEWKTTVQIERTDAEKRQVFGWLYIADDSEGNQVEDLKRAICPAPVLEDAAYSFVRDHRDMGNCHTELGVGVCIESMMFTREKWALLGGKPEGAPVTGWWVGFYVEDDATWDQIKRGELPMLSLAGKAEVEYLD